MKILLINPSQFFGYGHKMTPPYPPLGLLYIASAIEETGCQVRMADMDADTLTPESLACLLEDYKPDIVGITALSTAFGSALKIAKISKTNAKGAKVILGGIHATISPREAISDENVDFVVEGEGESVIKDFILQLKSWNPDFSKVKGLWYKTDGQIFNNPKPQYVANLDTLRFPARHLLKNPYIYTGQDVIRLPMASIITSRGCPGRCTYCQTKQIFGKIFRYRSVDDIIKEIDELVSKYKVKEIHIIDDAFTLHKKRVLEFCAQIKKRKYKLVFQLPNGVRADMLDEEILKALKSIGLVNISIGVETGSEFIRKKIKKEDISRDCIISAFKMAKKIGFETWGFFIIGLPDDNESTIRETIAFAKKLNPDFAKFLILKPFPGSEVFEDLNKRGLIFDHNYDNYGCYAAPVHRLENLSADDILYWQKKAFREFYFRPGKLLRFSCRRWTPVRVMKTFENLKFVLKRIA